MEQNYVVLQASGTWYVTEMTALKAALVEADQRIVAVVLVDEIKMKLSTSKP